MKAEDILLHLPNVLKADASTFDGIIELVFNFLFVIAAPLMVIAVIYSGIMYITASGDTTKAASARKNLVWAIIGLSFVILSELIVYFIGLAIKGELV